MKTQPRSRWILTVNWHVHQAGIKKAALTVGLIAFVVQLVLLATGIVSWPARANSSAQSSGYWQYIGTSNVSFGDMHTPNEWWSSTRNISDSGGHFVGRHGNEQTGDKADLDILEITCTWQITKPTNLDRLMPGDTVEATASCTDTS